MPAGQRAKFAGFCLCFLHPIFAAIAKPGRDRRLNEVCRMSLGNGYDSDFVGLTPRLGADDSYAVVKFTEIMPSFL